MAAWPWRVTLRGTTSSMRVRVGRAGCRLCYLRPACCLPFERSEFQHASKWHLGKSGAREISQEAGVAFRYLQKNPQTAVGSSSTTGSLFGAPAPDFKSIAAEAASGLSKPSTKNDHKAMMFLHT